LALLGSSQILIELAPTTLAKYLVNLGRVVLSQKLARFSQVSPNQISTKSAPSEI